MLIRSRRPKRNRYLQIGLFFIIYTCYHAYSAAVDRGEPTDEPLESVETTPNFTMTDNPVDVSHAVENVSISFEVIFNDLLGSRNRSNSGKSASPWLPDPEASSRGLHAARHRAVSASTHDRGSQNGGLIL